MYEYSNEQKQVFADFRDKMLKGLAARDVPCTLYKVTALEQAGVREISVIALLTTAEYRRTLGLSTDTDPSDPLWFHYFNNDNNYHSHSHLESFNAIPDSKGNGYNCHGLFVEITDAKAYVEAYNKAPVGYYEADILAHYDQYDDHDYSY